MNWDRVEGKWKQQRGKATHHWGNIMRDELAAVAGKYEALVGRLQEKYGIAGEQANARVAELRKTINVLRESNSRLLRLQKGLQGRTKPRRKAAGARTPKRAASRIRSRG